MAHADAAMAPLRIRIPIMDPLLGAGGRLCFDHAMSDVHSRVAAALSAQLGRWRTALAGGERRIGWKLGWNFPEVEAVIGPEPIIGYLTTGTLLGSGESYTAQDGAQLRAETEVALVIGEDVAADASSDKARAAIVGAAVALEIVDVSRPPADLEGIVIENAFHRAFVLGPARRIDPSRRKGWLMVNGSPRASATAGEDHGGVVRAVAQLLGAAGEQLQRGDHILSGALTHVAIQPGDEIKAEIQTLGAVTLTIPRKTSPPPSLGAA